MEPRPSLAISQPPVETIVVAVGSTRRPKIEAVHGALEQLAPVFWGPARFEIVSLDVASGVRHTPLSREEMMAGARHRAEVLASMACEKNEPWRYFLGLEGGLDVIRESGARRAFLQNWAYVADASGHGAFGQSGAVALPEALASRVLDESVELADAIDAFANESGIRDAQGAWGVLTRGLIARQDAVRVSVISAFAAFFALQQAAFRAALSQDGHTSS